MSERVLCLDIGGSFIKSALSSQAGLIEDRRERPVPVTNWTDFAQAISDIITEYGEALSPSSPLALSCAGVVDERNDTILSSNIPPFKGIRITESLRTLLKRPVAMANDADSFTLAEACYGEGQGLPVVLGIIIGSGVGGGIAINGHIFTGNQGISAEWGHAPITQTSLQLASASITLPRLPCGCGQVGCLDTLGGARGIERLHQLLTGEALSSREIIQAGLAAESKAATTLDAWLEIVADPLAHTVNIIGPHRIVVGGGLASEPTLISELDKRLRRRILLKTEQPLVVAGRHYREGGLIGASVLAHRLHPSV